MEKCIIDKLLSTGRAGIENLVVYLKEDTDFFKAPASTKYHGNYEGGLIEHSLNVYRLLSHKNDYFALGLPEETIILTSLLHDLCKCNFYSKEKKNVLKGKKISEWNGKEVNNWVEEEVFVVKDAFPIGHGEKSVIMALNFILLTYIEIAMIRWHMGFSEPKEAYMTLGNAMDLYPAIVAIHTADLEASRLLEKRKEE